MPGTVPGPKTQAASLGPPSSSPAWRGWHGPILQTRKPRLRREASTAPAHTAGMGQRGAGGHRVAVTSHTAVTPKGASGGAGLLRTASPSSVRKLGAWGEAGPPSPDPQGPWAFLNPSCYNPQVQRGRGLTGQGLGHTTPPRVSHRLAERPQQLPHLSRPERANANPILSGVGGIKCLAWPWLAVRLPYPP